MGRHHPLILRDSQAEKTGSMSPNIEAQLRFKDVSIWLVVSTPLKNISQIESFPQVGVKTKKYEKPSPSQPSMIP